MIPKIIHYCWVGGNPLPPLAKKCIDSWKKYCPDYEIIEWNETNYDFTKNKYMRQAYECKKWGFVPDYARLDIIYNNGGIYLDTDVELIKPIDFLLEYKCYAGMEKIGVVNLGQGFGAEKNSIMIKHMMDDYEHRDFIDKDGIPNLTPSPVIQTNLLKKHGFIKSDTIQYLDDITIFPVEYFNPINMETGELLIKSNTISVHHFAASWESKYNIFRGKVYRFINRNFGYAVANFIKKIFKKK